MNQAPIRLALSARSRAHWLAVRLSLAAISCVTITGCQSVGWLAPTGVVPDQAPVVHAALRDDSPADSNPTPPAAASSRRSFASLANGAATATAPAKATVGRVTEGAIATSGAAADNLPRHSVSRVSYQEPDQPTDRPTVKQAGEMPDQMSDQEVNKNADKSADQDADKNAAEEVPAPPKTRPVLELDPGHKTPDPRPLSLREVSESVYASFPALEAAMREIDIADGKATSALGEFDLKLKAESMSAPEGFYQTYRNLVKLEQALFPGGYVFGQYRIGDGNFQPWFGERETNEGGEFKVAWITPLLRDRRIDDRRAELFKATLRRQQVDPSVQAQLLEYILAASEAYWTWVAAGLSYDAQRELLRVTVERNRVYEERVKQEDLARIELVQNQRLIASREAKVIEAQRKLQISAIKLSLFLRDEQGRPVVPPPALLPARFPTPPPPPEVPVLQDIDRALANRPELIELNFMRQQYEVDLAYGENMRLPYLSATFEAAKDVGAPASSKGDKTPFEMEAGLLFDVPLQRRKAEGKIREAYGKLAQLSAKRRLVENKIAIQVQDAHSALATTYAQYGRAIENHRLARELESAERQRFDAEDSDLLRVAIQEGAEIEAALLVIDTQSEYFKAEAAYRAAVAADPLADQPAENP